MSAPIVHPSWCEPSACGVQVLAGVPIGAHRSRVVVIGATTRDDVEVKLCLWQVHGREVYVSLDWNRPHGVPVDGILFDPPEAVGIGRVIRDLAGLAQREATS